MIGCPFLSRVLAGGLLMGGISMNSVPENASTLWLVWGIGYGCMVFMLF